MTPPSGTVCFLFTDIEGSTRLWEDGAARMSEAGRRGILDIVREYAGTREAGR